MKRPAVRRITLATLVLSLAGWLVWELFPARELRILAGLTNPRKLATLGERGANERLCKIIYWLDAVDRKGMSVERALPLVQAWNRVPERHAVLVRTALQRNWQLARDFGLLTPENLEALRRGKAPVITRGPHAGETIEVDHIVPYSLAPEAGNDLSNLELTPRSVNRRKSNRVGPAQLEHAARLLEARLITAESYGRVTARNRDTAREPAGRRD